MSILADPLRDSLNPPPRYQIESDSEDEIGEGMYGLTKPVRSGEDRTGTHTFALDGEVRVGGLIIVGVGAAGSQLKRTLPIPAGATEGIIEADGMKIGTVSNLSASQTFTHVSSKLPPSLAYPLSRWLISTFKPNRLEIVDTYPSPLYIGSPPTAIRDLATSTLSGTTSSNKAYHVETILPFSPPNLLSTQSLSAALLPVAQAEVFVGADSLREGARLILLPSPRIPIVAPVRLDSADIEAGLALGDALWSPEQLSVVAGAVGIEHSIPGTPQPSRPPRRPTSAMTEGMYI